MLRAGEVGTRVAAVARMDVGATPMAGETPQVVFDRGTLRFDGDWQARVLAELPGVMWDARTERYRAPPWRYRELMEAIAMRVPGQVDGALGTRETTGGWQDISLRPYQAAAVAAWSAAGRRGVVVLPTGAGKTRVALAAMAAARCPTLCLVPTCVLMHQWCAELRRFHRGEVGCWGDRERRLAPVTVITFESAYRHMAEMGARFGMLVVDEVHHFGAGVRDEALEMCAAPFRLGLTATLGPGSARREAATEGAVAAIERLVGPVVVELRVEDLAGRFLAPLDVVELRLPLDRDERARYDAEWSAFAPFYRAFRMAFPGASWKDFSLAAWRTAEGRRALAAWRHARALTAFTRGKGRALAQLLERHAGSRVLVFTADNETAYAIARERLLMPITCDIGREERERVLERFRRGELRALVSARVLNEGIDVPDADVAVIVGGSHGEREHVQRIGRLLRPQPGKRAVVYELVAAGTSEALRARQRRRALGAKKSREAASAQARLP
jgi:superfamily II DNA or RNA helicase